MRKEPNPPPANAIKPPAPPSPPAPYRTEWKDRPGSCGPCQQQYWEAFAQRLIEDRDALLVEAQRLDWLDRDDIEIECFTSTAGEPWVRIKNSRGAVIGSGPHIRAAIDQAMSHGRALPNMTRPAAWKEKHRLIAETSLFDFTAAYAVRPKPGAWRWHGDGPHEGRVSSRTYSAMSTALAAAARTLGYRLHDRRPHYTDGSPCWCGATPVAPAAINI